MKSRISGRELEISKLDEAVNVAIAQAANACKGIISGPIAQASYEAALETSNRLWEWYSETNTLLNKCIRELRDAGASK